MKTAKDDKNKQRNKMRRKQGNTHKMKEVKAKIESKELKKMQNDEDREQ